jgi:Asp-tRNA(Asn)/Glu-tRNA(Gln) amidotransferase A subunit family amidase
VAPWHRYFEDIDALILPVTPTTAFTHRETGADVAIDGEPTSYWEHGRLAALCNATGLPSLAAPAGLDDGGLPIGVQLIGPLWSEVHLLDIARALEGADVLPGFRAPP